MAHLGQIRQGGHETGFVVFGDASVLVFLVGKDDDVVEIPVFDARAVAGIEKA